MKFLSSGLCLLGLGVSSFIPANDGVRAPPTTSVLVERDFHDTTNTNTNAFAVHIPDDNEHWSARFRVFLNVANPLQATMAANDLTQFYSVVLTMARVVWARGTPRTWRRAAMGGLVLMFQSDSPIPWEFLRAFLTTMIDRTRGGFVGGYDLLCIDALRDSHIRVSLIVPSEVVGTAAAAA